ncbi:hypothetical protein BC832DRAFT_84043 [Gaertneriomyces semiglobifer]|nr:hypothetical protein BC832DRAFT_84043 [Gaertneriomyces semiglobifer]
MATVETCTGNPAVMGFFMTNFVYPQITLYATDYGGPGILLGTAWPFVFAAFAIAVWRVYTRPSLRAALLLAATSVNVADCANVTWARSIDPLKLRLMVKQYLYLAIIFAQIKVAILIWAAGIRCENDSVRVIF